MELWANCESSSMRLPAVPVLDDDPTKRGKRRLGRRKAREGACAWCMPPHAVIADRDIDEHFNFATL